jgi:hypothetical protein
VAIRQNSPNPATQTHPNLHQPITNSKRLSPTSPEDDLQVQCAIVNDARFSKTL